MIQKAFANDGFGIWLIGGAGNCDIHINEWLSPPNTNYIDFGIRIYDAQRLEQLFLSIPFKLTINELENLSEHFRNEEVARGIFNTNCVINQASNNPIINLNYNNRNESVIPVANFDSITTSIQTFLEEPYGQYSILKIDFSLLNRNNIQDECYIRFRFPHKTLNKLFSTPQKAHVSRIASPILKWQYNYFMKINEVRSLPSAVRYVSKLNAQKINKIIVTISSDGRLDIDNSECYKVRQLEKPLYQKYVPQQFSCDDAISYQWLTEGKTRYNFSFRIRKETISKNSLFQYAGIALLLSLLSNIIFELLKYLF